MTSLFDPLRRLKAVGLSRYFKNLYTAHAQILEGASLIGLDFAPNVKPRYGYDRPPLLEIESLLRAQKEIAMGLSRALLARKRDWEEIATTSSDPLKPQWGNGWFSPLDAMVLSQMLIQYNPRTFFEVGSGNSTLFARWTIQKYGLRTAIISVDPSPRREIESVADKVYSSSLADVDTGAWSELEKGDIFFLDGSHRMFQNSDATVFFLEILPTLKERVLYHIHDIMLPTDYPPAWSQQYFSELYMLAQFLQYNCAQVEVLFPAYFFSTANDFKEVREELFSLAPFQVEKGGVSFWFRPTGRD
jgi:hypothetical protein